MAGVGRHRRWTRLPIWCLVAGVLGWASCAHPQGLIPNAQTQFLDFNGAPLAGGFVYMYVPNTTTSLGTWQDPGLTVPNSNPIHLDAAGEARIWGNGAIYRQVVTRADGSLIWDQATTVNVGTVKGPASSVVGDVAIWNNTQGTLLADSGIILGTLASQNANNVNITGGSITGVTLNVTNATLTTPTIVSPNITGGTIAGTVISSSVFSGSLGAGTNVCANLANPRNGNYTAGNSDEGTLIELGGNITSTLTVPNGLVGGWTACVANLDGLNAKHIALPSGTTWLWPGQITKIYVDGTGTVRRSQPERYLAPGLTVFASSAAGSDANDCLSAVNACQHIQTAIILIRSYVDTQDSVPTIQVEDGVYTEAIDTSATPTGGADQIIISGNIGTPSNVQLIAPAGHTAVTVRDYGIFTLENMELACGAGDAVVNSSQFGVADLRNFIVGSCDGKNAIIAQDEGHINIETGMTISGNAAAMFYSHGTGAQISAGGGQTITCTGPFAITNFLNMDNGSGFTTEGVPLVFSGCGSVTGTQYNVTTNSVADTSGSTLPGSAGSVSTGGIYN